MAKIKEKVELWNPKDLTPYHRNTKAHPTEQVDKIASSIAEFGFDQPIVVDTDGVIIKGHGRREAALRLKLDKVPVIVRDDMTETQKKAARIADNKVAESAWLEVDLAFELEELKEADFDLSLTGFSVEDSDIILNGNIAPDDSILNELQNDETENQLNEMKEGVKRAILIEFNSTEEYQEAFEIIKIKRKEKKDIGQILLHALKQ